MPFGAGSLQSEANLRREVEAWAVHNDWAVAWGGVNTHSEGEPLRLRPWIGEGPVRMLSLWGLGLSRLGRGATSGDLVVVRCVHTRSVCGEKWVVMYQRSNVY